MYIYKTTNVVNGKIYIGKSKKDLNASKGYMGSGIQITEAIRKYGKHNFKKDILEDNIKDLNTLNERETYYIQLHRSSDRSIGYNISLGGDGGDTITQNPRRDEIVESRTGENNPFFGRHHSKKTRRALRDMMINRKLTDDQKLKISKGLRAAYQNGSKSPTITDQMRRAARERFLKNNPSKTKEWKEKTSKRMALNNPERKDWIFERITGETFIRSGLKKACNEFNLPYGSMRKRIGKPTFNKQGWKLYERNH